MEAQIPAEGIVKMKPHPGWRYYTIPCECGCNSQVQLTFEIDDPTDKLITCRVYSKVKTDYWTEFWTINYSESWFIQGLKSLVNGTATRMKLIWNILVNGYIEMESFTLLTEQQALNMSATIKLAIEDLRNENKSI